MGEGLAFEEGVDVGGCLRWNDLGCSWLSSGAAQRCLIGWGHTRAGVAGSSRNGYFFARKGRQLALYRRGSGVDFELGMLSGGARWHGFFLCRFVRGRPYGLRLYDLCDLVWTYSSRIVGALLGFSSRCTTVVAGCRTRSRSGLQGCHGCSAMQVVRRGGRRQ